MSIKQNIKSLIALLRPAQSVELGDEGSEESDSASAGRAGLYALAIRLANAGIAYVTQIIFARLLGEFEYGIFALGWVWIAILGHTSTFGFSMTAIRFLAQYEATGERDRAAGFFRFSLLVPLIVSSLAAIGGVALLSADVLPIADYYVLPLMLAMVCVPLFAMQDMMESYARARHWVMLALVPTYLLRHGFLGVFLILAVLFGFEANAITALMVAFIAIGGPAAIQAVLLWRRYRAEADGQPPAQPAYQRKEWFKASAPLALTDGASLLVSYSDILVLSYFVPPSEIGIYFAATRIAQIVGFVRFAASAGTANVFSKLNAQGRMDELKTLSRATVRISFALSFVACAGLAAVGILLLKLFGSNFTAGYPALLVLMVGMLIQSAFSSAEDLLNMTGNQGMTARSYFGALVVNIVLNLVLIPPFGLIGAAFATSFALSFRAIYLGFGVRSRLGISLFGAQFKA
ncbi:MAG: polysaccharide biosynthesis protein [Hyphomicrobiales bacterium]|nr:MAG: polysaccharide biosynthesis protein [Hyphomicrobiales bacterium]